MHVGIRPKNPGENAEQGGLAAPGRADDIEHFSEARFDADVTEGSRSGLAFPEVLHDPPLSTAYYPRKISKGSIRNTLRTPK